MRTLLAIVFSVGSLNAATLCVGPAATGNGSGADWNNLLAWSATPTRGDTWYLADGTYTGKTLSVAASGTTLIIIKKAIAADHSTDTGWVGTMGDGVAEFSNAINFTTSYWTFDGQTGGGPGSWDTGFGFKINEVGDALAIIEVGRSTTASYITVRHVELQGKGSVSGTGGGDSNDAIALWIGSNFTLSYAYMDGIGRCPFFISPQDFVAEYVYVKKFYGSGAVHSEVSSTYSFGQTIGDTTFRYCVFADIQSTGGIMWDNVGNTAAVCRIYGCVFYHPSGSTWVQANGLIGGWAGGNSEQCHNMLVYNNTFIDTESGGEVLSSFPNIYSNLQAKNNLFYSVGSVGSAVKWSMTHNHFISTTEGGTSTSTGTGDPFTDYVNFDFSLTANTTAGTDLGAPFNVDMLGNTRTTWTRGAIEYGGSPAPPATGTRRAGKANFGRLIKR
jgi:hypothetical protein